MEYGLNNLPQFEHFAVKFQQQAFRGTSRRPRFIHFGPVE